MNAGLKAPTNDHLRNWEFVVVTEKAEKAKIISKIPKAQPKYEVANYVEVRNMADISQRDMYIDAIPKQFSMLYHGGCLILPFFKQESPLLEPKTLSSLNAFASIWCCIENILLAATADGLCVALRIPDNNEDEYLKEVIGHPEHYVMPCYLSIGYPSENAVINSQHEYDSKDKIHINQW